MPKRAERAVPQPMIAPVAAPSGTYLVTRARPVVTHPAPVLAARTAEDDPSDPAVVALAGVLVTTMRASPACVGLAAPQIGEGRRMFCMDVTGHPRARSCAGLVVMVNPRIVARTEPVVMREGCMSVPDLTGNVARPEEVLVVGLEPGSGRIIQVEADGIEARCLQHEIDHLNGLLFLDHVHDPRGLFARRSYASPRG